MKTPTEDHELIRWLDGEMTAAERERFAARMASDPALMAEADAIRQLGDTLRAHLPTEMPVPHADFFNSQIQVRLAQEEEQRLRVPARRSWLLDWFRPPVFATSLAVAAAVVVAGIMVWQGDDKAESVVLSTYTPNPGVQAHAYHSEEAQATVLMLEGLDAMPPDRKIIGYNIQHSEREQDVATTLYGERGEVVLVVSQDVRHQPRLLTASTRP